MQLIKDIIRATPFRKLEFKGQLFGTIMSSIFGVAGAFLFITHFLNPAIDSRRAQNWIQIDATVLTLELEKKLHLEYRYHYKNKDYLGNQITFTKYITTYSYEHIHDIEKHYPKGSTIPIWINPSNPDESVYDKEINLFNWIALVISISPIILVLWKFVDILSQSTIYRMRKRVTEEITNYASQHSAHEISEALKDNNWDTQESYRISYLKHANLQYFYIISLILLKINCLLLFGFFPITIFERVFPPHAQYFYLSIFILCNLCYLSMFLKISPKRRSYDYIILSTWDQSLNSITHHWLLLSNQCDVLELCLQTTLHNKTSIKKHLKQNPIKDIFKSLDAQQGRVTHTVEKSTENYYKLIIQIKNQATSRSHMHNILIKIPDIKAKL